MVQIWKLGYVMDSKSQDFILVRKETLGSILSGLKKESKWNLAKEHTGLPNFTRFLKGVASVHCSLTQQIKKIYTNLWFWIKIILFVGESVTVESKVSEQHVQKNVHRQTVT